MNINFVKKQAVSQGWQLYKKHLKFILGIILIFFGVNVLRFLLSFFLQNNQSAFLSLVVSIFFAVLSIVMQMGVVKVLLNIIDKKTLDYHDLFRSYRFMLSYMLAVFVNAVIVIAGLVLFIVPGIYFALRYQFYLFVMLDKKTGALESLYLSEKITKGNLTNLFLFDLLMLLLNILGLLCLVVGLFVTIPVTSLANAWVYRKLSASKA